MLKGRGAEQGDVDGPLECAAQQGARTLIWIGIDDPVEERRLQAEHENKMQTT